MILHLNTANLCGCVVTLKHTKCDPTPKDATEEAALGELGNDVALRYIMPSDDG